MTTTKKLSLLFVAGLIALSGLVAGYTPVAADQPKAVVTATPPGINFSPQLGEPWSASPNGLLWVQGVGKLGIDQVVCEENCQIVSAKKVLAEGTGELLGYHVAIAATKPGRVKFRVGKGDVGGEFPVVIRNYKPK